MALTSYLNPSRDQGYLLVCSPMRLKFGMWPPGGPWRLPWEFHNIWRPLRSWPPITQPLLVLYIMDYVSLVPLVQSGLVSTFFASTDPQESDSDIDSCNGTRHCALGPILRPQFLTLLSVVQSLSVLPFFACTEPQESDSDIDSCNGTRQCALRPILRPEFPTLLSVLQSWRSQKQCCSEGMVLSQDFFFKKIGTRHCALGTILTPRGNCK